MLYTRSATLEPSTSPPRPCALPSRYIVRMERKGNPIFKPLNENKPEAKTTEPVPDAEANAATQL